MFIMKLATWIPIILYSAINDETAVVRYKNSYAIFYNNNVVNQHFQQPFIYGKHRGILRRRCPYTMIVIFIAPLYSFITTLFIYSVVLFHFK